jgi:excisionase family DNA binding protein
MASLAIPVGRGRLLTVPETAKRLRVSTRTVLRLIERDELPSLQLGAQRGAPVRIDEAELLAWLYGDLGAAA